MEKNPKQIYGGTKITVRKQGKTFNAYCKSKREAAFFAVGMKLAGHKDITVSDFHKPEEKK